MTPRYPKGKITTVVLLLLIATGLKVFAQAPVISYAGPQNYTVNKAITSLSPGNSGGAVGSYGQVSTLAGGTNGAGNANGPGSTASFSSLTGVAADAQGNLYVADYANNLIRKITADGTVSTYAGTGANGAANGAATGATFAYPCGVAVDYLGNVYVADRSNFLIRKITTAGVVSTFAGTGTKGSTNGTSIAASFSDPLAITTDAQGTIYVVDNDLIRKITQQGVVTTIAGTGAAGNANGTGTAASFYSPMGIAVDTQGNLYIADTDNNLIRKIIISTGVVSTFAGSGAAGSTNGSGTSASFFNPSGLAVDAAGNLYVAQEGGSSYNLIRKITSTGVVTTLAGSIGTQGRVNGTGAAASFNAPYGIAVDAYNNVYVAEFNGVDIRKIITNSYNISPALPAGLNFDTATGIISGTPTATSVATTYTIAGNNSSGSGVVTLSISVTSSDATMSNLVLSTGTLNPVFTPAATSYSASETNATSNITITPTASNSNAKVTVNGTAVTSGSASGSIPLSVGSNTITTVVTAQDGTTTQTYTLTVTRADTPPVITYSPASLDAVNGTAISSSAPGNTGGPVSVYGQVSTFAGGGSLVGSLNGLGTSASFFNPIALARDASGNIYVADYGNKTIRKIATDGTVTTFAGTTGVSGATNGTGTAATFSRLRGLAVDASGNIYVADTDNNLIRKITSAGAVTTFAGSGAAGSANGTGTAASFNSPLGMAVDASGNVYVTDAGDNLIRKITSGGVVTTLAGSGNAGFADGTGSAASFKGLSGITVSSTGDLYVSDAGNSLIRKVTSTAGVVTTFAGTLGIRGQTDGTGTAATFYAPQNICADNFSNLYVADNYEIRKITLAGVVTTLAGNASSGSANGVGSAAAFNNPVGVTTDALGNVYVADTFNNLIRKITTGYFADPALPAGLTVNSSTGVISGTPTVDAASRPYFIMGSNSAGSTSVNFFIRVSGKPSITSFTPTNPAPGTSVTITGTGLLNASSVTFGGNAAASITSNSDTQIIAVIGQAATGSVGVTTPGGTTSATGLTAGGPPAITYSTPQTYTVGVTITPLAPTNTGGPATGYTLIGTLPGGLSFDTSTGIVSGTPQVTLTSTNYNVSAASSGYSSVSTNFNLTVNAPPAPNLSTNAIGTQAYTANTAITPITIQNTGGAVYTFGQMFTFSRNPGFSSLATDQALDDIYYAIGGSTTINKSSPPYTSITPTTVTGGASIFGNNHVAFYGNSILAPATFNGKNDIVLISSTGSAFSIFGGNPPANPGYDVAVDGTEFYANNGSTITHYTVGSTTGTVVANISGFNNKYVAYGRIYSFTTQTVTQLGLSGSTVFAGGGTNTGNGDGIGTAAYFTNIKDIVAANGYLYVIDNYAIRQISLTTGQVITIAGNSASGYHDGVGAGAGFNNPTSISYDGTGLLVLDGTSVRRVIITNGYSVSPALPAGLSVDINSGTISGTPISASPPTTYTITAANSGGTSTTTAKIGVTGTSDAILSALTISSGFLTPGFAYGTNSYAASIANAVSSITFTPTANNVSSTITVNGTAVTSGSASGAIALNLGGNKITIVVTAADGVTTNTYTVIATRALPAAPILAYAGPQAYTVTKPITALSPTNTGGAIPAIPYGQVNTLAGTGFSGSANGTGTAASFKYPSGVATDAQGNVYVVDQSANQIRMVTPAGVTSTFAGSGAAGSANGTGTAASFNQPFGIAIDASGNLYIADSGNNMIRMITPAGVVSTLAGTGAQGANNGAGSVATFKTPQGVAVDASGNVYVADTYNQLIRKITSAGVVSTFAGTGSIGSTNATGTAASFDQPTGIAVDASGNVYVVDNANDLIRKITTTAVVSTFAGSLNFGSANGTGTAATFGNPRGISIDGLGNLYIADAGNQLIRKITSAGVVTTLAGTVSNSGSANGIGTTASFNFPVGLAADNKGNLYIADGNNYLVRNINVTGYSVTPTLPAGLAFDVSTGIISGTPTAVTASNTYTINGYNAGGSASATVTIAVNAISTDATLSALTISSGTLSPAFAAATTAYSVLEAGSITSITITPTQNNPNASITVNGITAGSGVASSAIALTASGNTVIPVVVTAQDGSTKTYTITCVRTSFSAPSSIDFGTINSTTTKLSGFILNGTNLGTSTTTLTAPAPFTVSKSSSGPFSSSISFTSTEVAAGPSVIVQFAPTGAGAASGNLNITNPNLASPVIVALTANAVKPGLTVTPSSIAFGNTSITSTMVQTFSLLGQYLTNSTNLTVTNPYSLSKDGITYSLSLNYSVSEIASAQTVYVRYSPSALVTSNNSVSIVSPGVSSTSVSLTGTGVPAPSTDATLSALVLSSGSLTPVFAAGTTSYSVSETNSTSSVTVTPTRNNQYANITVNGTAVTSGSASAAIALNIGSNTITVVVTAQDGTTTQTYTIIVTRAATPPAIAYTGPQTYTLNKTIISLAPTNSGGAVPNLLYGQVTAFAGTGVAGSTNGNGPAASFKSLAGLAIDAAGNIYVADGGNNLIRKITPAGVVSTYAGTGVAGAANGSTTTATFKGPLGVAVDKAGNVYVADSNNDLIRKITPAGVVSTFAGSGSDGSTNGTGTAASFSLPTDIVIDSSGNLFVNDGGDGLIRKITSSGVVTTFSGGYNGAFGLAIDASDNVYVADYSPRIYKITPTGSVSLLAGSGTPGSADGTGAAASFRGPNYMTADALGNIYVADSENNLIRKVTPTGVVTTLAGSGVSGTANGIGKAATFNFPFSVVIDNSGNLVESEQSGDYIRKINIAGYVVNQALPIGLAIDGTGTISGAPTVVSPAANYTVVAYNSAGNSTATVNIAVVANDATLSALTASTGTLTPTFLPTTTGYAISVANTTSSITLTPTTGSAAATLTINGTAATSGAASAAIALNTGDNTITIVVTAQDGTTKQTYTITVTRAAPAAVFAYAGPVVYPAGTAITPLAPSNSAGTIATGGTKQVSTFATALGYGVVTDAQANVFIADAVNNVIKKITPAGTISVFAGSGTAGSANGTGVAASFKNPVGLTIDASGNLYVADSGNNQIREITSTGVVTTFAGSGTAGAANGTGTAASFNQPYGVTADTQGNIYVSDAGNNLIRRITASGTVTTLAGSGISGSANGTGTAASFNFPQGIAVDAQGNVYVAEYNNNKVRKITAAGLVRTFAGTGEYGADNGTGSSATFYGPTGVTLDTQGNLYVSDSGSNLVRKISSTGVVSTYAGSGATGSANGLTTAASFNGLTGLAFSITGDLYIADTYNGLIRVLQTSGYTVTPALPAGLTISATTGTISGTPTAPSAATLYTITSNNGAESSATVTITVSNTGYVNSLDKVNTTLAASSAYSLRQLRTTYSHNTITAPAAVAGFSNATMPVIRVRRSSDNGQLDIGYTANGDLDTTALKSFVGNANGYVSVWYDQSSNSYDVNQPVASQQPVIVTAGVVERSGAMPAVRFSNSAQTVLYNNIPADVMLASGYIGTAFPVMEASAMAINSSAFGYGKGTDRWQVHANEGGYLKFDVGANLSRIQYANDANATIIKNYSFIAGINLQQAYVGGILQASSTAALTGCSQTQFNIGGIPAFGYYHNNHESEIIIYASSVSTADRQIVEANQYAYYLAQAIIALDKTGVSSPATAAYSLRQLNSKYTHAAIKLPEAVPGFTNSATPVIRVRRSLDNAMIDVGYTANGDLDTVAIKSFVGTASGYVATWYDQSGKSNDAYQTNIFQQPFIVLAGVVQRSGVRPSVLFVQKYQTALQSNVAASALFGSGYIGSVFPVMEASSGYGSAFGYGNGYDRWQVHANEGDSLKFDIGGGTTFNRVGGINTGNAGILKNYSFIANTNLQQAYISGTLLSSSTSPLTACTQTVFNIGGIPAFNYYHNGHESEIIIYGTALSTADRQTLEAGQVAYYFPQSQAAMNAPSFKVNISQPALAASSNVVNLGFSATGGEGNSNYQLQKLSNNGFGSIAVITGSGTGSFTTADTEPLSGNNYYRIAATDSKGKLVYSTTVNLNVTTGKGILVYPNPVVNSNMVLNFNGMNKGSYNLTLVDAVGNVVLHKAVSYDGYSSSMAVPVPNTKIGVYILNITSASYQRTLRLIFE